MYLNEPKRPNKIPIPDYSNLPSRSLEIPADPNRIDGTHRFPHAWKDLTNMQSFLCMLLEAYMLTYKHGDALALLIAHCGPTSMRETIFKRSLPLVREFYDNLPEMVDVYRGWNDEEGIGLKGISWTTNPSATEMFIDPMFTHGIIHKSNIYAIVPHSQDEILLDPADVTIIAEDNENE